MSTNKFCRYSPAAAGRGTVLAAMLIMLCPVLLFGEESSERVYLVGEEDVITISVWGQEELSVSIPVRPDGRISLPLVGEVMAAGRTPEQIKAVIEQELPKYFTSQQTVSVIVTEINSKKVYILGEVESPGWFNMRSSLTALQLLALAGGLTEFADRSGIMIIRHLHGGAENRILFDYKKAVSAKGGGGDTYLEPGDIVVVP